MSTLTVIPKADNQGVCTKRGLATNRPCAKQRARRRISLRPLCRSPEATYVPLHRARQIIAWPLLKSSPPSTALLHPQVNRRHPEFIICRRFYWKSLSAWRPLLSLAALFASRMGFSPSEEFLVRGIVVCHGHLAEASFFLKCWPTDYGNIFVSIRFPYL